MTNRDPRGGDALDREFDEALALAKDPASQGRTAQDSASQDPAQRPGWSSGAPGAPGAPGASGASGAPGPRGPHRHRPATPWPDARAIAARAPRKSRPSPTTATLDGTPVARPLPEALGHVLAAPLTALTDLPSFDTSAMDGWALAGPGPWRLPAADQSVLAGHAEADPLPDGHAIRIATGARVPPGATAVLRTEHGAATGGWLYAAPAHPVSPGQDIRPRGQECRSGDLLLPAGAVITPVILGLAAAAGYDELPTMARPRVEILVLGDELLRQGLPHDGRIRDALGPMLAPWLRALGAEPLATRRLADDAEALYAAVAESPADVVLTTGGTAAGPVDHVHPTLRRLDAELLVDGVAVRPGHPMLLARLAPHKHLVGLPGNPLAAVSGLLTLAEPLLRTLTGRPAPAPCPAPLAAAVHGHPRDTRLVPVVFREDEAFPLRFNGPAMLRGVAVADGLAVIPPGGAERGTDVEVLDLPWSTAWPGPQE
ncbi:molybdopterin molybdotransferase MoeA [Streptomyces sparsogenes]|uniref:Molybdopterin molybdenumtransferase n=1 Tax=Streptomyces sparsogenes DSM 40356 TaxID=1331668 RepID=A0A1R1SKQ4_9ACTN|nr:molybdopterin molybdotransferase MoeA [Streptomyces sparsogenes]OMI38852.1 molybdenum cofactor biosynthesis protein [Streptomyces sparsogenes DSM 40356]